MKKNQEDTDSKVIYQVKVINNINEGVVKPFENTNVYLGVYDDGTEFGVKKTATGYTILEGYALETVKEESKKLSEKKKRRVTLDKVVRIINKAKDDVLSAEEIRKNVLKSLHCIENEEEQGTIPSDISEDEYYVSTETLRSRARNSIFSEAMSSDELDAASMPKLVTKPRRKGPPIIGREFKGEPIVRDTAVTLESLSRKRANRTRIFGLTKDGKQMFTDLTDFYDYVRDPKNGLSDIINTQEDFDSLLDTIENCR